MKNDCCGEAFTALRNADTEVHNGFTREGNEVTDVRNGLTGERNWQNFSVFGRKVRNFKNLASLEKA
jgi:hypothetical protein